MYGEWERKHAAQQNFPVHRMMYFSVICPRLKREVPEVVLASLMLTLNILDKQIFPVHRIIYFSQIYAQVKKRSARGCSGVFNVNFEYTWHVVLFFFCFFLLTLNLYILDGILYYLNNLILSLHFRGVSKSPVIFKMKLYVTTLNNSFQSWPIFVAKRSILDVA